MGRSGRSWRRWAGGAAAGVLVNGLALSVLLFRPAPLVLRQQVPEPPAVFLRLEHIVRPEQPRSVYPAESSLAKERAAAIAAAPARPAIASPVTAAPPAPAAPVARLPAAPASTETLPASGGAAGEASARSAAAVRGLQACLDVAAGRVRRDESHCPAGAPTKPPAGDRMDLLDAGRALAFGPTGQARRDELVQTNRELQSTLSGARGNVARYGCNMKDGKWRCSTY